jgi:hypothetical protein
MFRMKDAKAFHTEKNILSKFVYVVQSRLNATDEIEMQGIHNKKESKANLSNWSLDRERESDIAILLLFSN